MFSVLKLSELDPQRLAVVSSDGSASWSQLLGMSRELADRYGYLRGQRVGVCMRARGLELALLAALDQLGCDVFLVNSELAPDSAKELCQQFEIGALVDGQSVSSGPKRMAGDGRGSVTILTSGTTGVPKAARHTWAGLARPVRFGGDFHRANWLLCYRPNLYAGLQVMLQCLCNGGTLVAPSPHATATEVAELSRTHAVTFASATPSYWRWMLTFADRAAVREWSLCQITLGGEVVDQRILDQLAGCFPEARLVHVYATTELGRCFSVTDGRAGFPSRFLGQPSADGVEMKIEDGELLVRSANAMCEYDPLCRQRASGGDWFHTGDLVEQAGNRCLFLGRKAEVINVGGNKVSPQRVEQVVQSVAGVRDAIAFGRTSSLVGQLVVCDVVIADGSDTRHVVEAVRHACAAALQPYERPRMINVVREIGLSASGKKVRSDKT